jgi:hypothetical protein
MTRKRPQRLFIYPALDSRQSDWTGDFRPRYPEFYPALATRKEGFRDSTRQGPSDDTRRVDLKATRDEAGRVTWGTLGNELVSAG